MKRFIIEREIPGVGRMTQGELRSASQRSKGALDELGTRIQWVQSFVTADKTFCVYLADDEEVIRRHAELSGFPANVITEVTGIIDPTTAATCG